MHTRLCSWHHCTQQPRNRNTFPLTDGRVKMWWVRVLSRSVVSDSLQPHGIEPASFLCPRYSPGKNTGVSNLSLSLLQRIFPIQGLNLYLLHWQVDSVPLRHQGSPHIFWSIFISVQFSSVAQSCMTLCNPMNHSTPGLPVHHQLLESTQTHVC